MPRTFDYDADIAGRILEELDATLFRLSTSAPEVETDDLKRGRHNHPLKAQVSRDFLRAKQLAGLLEAELEAQYMRFKGYDDPRIPA